MPSSTRRRQATGKMIDNRQEPIEALPLGTVLQACPKIRNYDPNGVVESWRDLLSAPSWFNRC
ncbi:hypothetical protein [Ensifer sp. MJa1]|uniref:hypothetical protein n=1 Tax=Ensifer sp. MJa1 TaxID=2919888 RepID=UPI003FA5E6A7